MTLDDFFISNYTRIFSFAKTYSKDKDPNNIDDIVHFTIDYFYFKSNKKKIDQLLADGKMGNYFYSSLKTNFQSKTAPYYNQTKKKIENEICSLFDEESENENYQNSLTEQEYDLDQDYLISYKYDTVIKLLHSEYVKSKFNNVEHYEYAKKIFLLFVNEEMSLNQISKKTSISLQTINWNFKKVRTIIINILKDKDKLKELLPDVDYNKITESIDPKKTNTFYMDYFTILNEFQTYLPNVKSSLLKKAASAKSKYLSNGTPREKLYVAIDVYNHYIKAANIVSDKKTAQERVNLYVEYISPNTTVYNNISCSTCMDFITRQIIYIIEKHKVEINTFE